MALSWVLMAPQADSAPDAPKDLPLPPGKSGLPLLLKDYAWELTPGQNLEYTLIPFPRPKGGIQLRFRRLSPPRP